MNVHLRTEEFKPNRTALPRRLVGRRPAFRFEIGQIVASGDMIALVTNRRRTAAGRETYDVEVLGADHGRPHRVFLGESLRAYDDETEAGFRCAALLSAGREVLLLPEGDGAIVRALQGGA